MAKAESFTQIARRHQCTPERIRQLAEVAGVKAADWRSVARHRRAEALQATLPTGNLRLVWDEALQRGLEVKRVLVLTGGNPWGVRERRLLINGRTCAVSVTRRCYHARREGEKGYGYHQLGTSPRDFQVFENAVPGYPRRFFVVPWCMLDRRRHCYIPLEMSPPYHNVLPKIDWWSYQDAWHLLNEMKKKD